MTYIKEYQEGNKFFGIYLCKSKQVLKTKAGKTYYSLLLQDKTGIIDGKVWELTNAINDFDQHGFYYGRWYGYDFSGEQTGKH